MTDYHNISTQPAIFPIPAFEDNYIWAVHLGAQVYVIDPGQAAPVLAYLRQHTATLCGIFITHQHADHIGGVAELYAASQCKILSPKSIDLGVAESAVTRVEDGQSYTLFGDSAQLHMTVFATPGHTAEHVSYLAQVEDASKTESVPWLFCGDTLFGAGCGRVMEHLGGRMEDLYHSLQKIAQLPDNTLLFPAHEYTQSNVKFAQAVSADLSFEIYGAQERLKLAHYKNAANALRAMDRPSLPTSLSDERMINPFLRAQDLTTFSALRLWKNTF